MDKKNTGNILFVCFLTYILVVICIEWINFIFKLAGKDLHFGIAEIISSIFVFGLIFANKKGWEKKHININIEMIIGIIIIATFGFIVSVYPDKAGDTYNYHLIAQNPKFENYFTEDYAYGHFQVWGFRLSDRLFYYFRYALGFRMGTILNTLVLVVSFTQLYNMLGWINDNIVEINGKFQKIICNKLIWSLGILLPLDVIFMLGTYYVDAIALPIMLEVIRLLMDNKQQTTKDIAYFALLNGIWIAFKLTNVVYVVPCVCIYVLKNYKSFKVYDWFLAILLGVFPFLEYIIFNTICTGNPVFPYFNAIFKSQYFRYANWKDARWGPTRLLEKIFWVVYAAFKPEYRQAEIYDNNPVTLILGLLSVLLILGCFFGGKVSKKHIKISREYLLLLVVGLTTALLWSFTTGYRRYYLLGRIIWGILGYWVLVYFIKRRQILGSVLMVCCSVFLISGLGKDVYSSTVKGTNWCSRSVSKDTFVTQVKKIFSDRDIMLSDAL